MFVPICSQSSGEASVVTLFNIIYIFRFSLEVFRLSLSRYPEKHNILLRAFNKRGYYNRYYNYKIVIY